MSRPAGRAIAAAALALLAAPCAAEDAPTTGAASLQARVDAAAPGTRIEVTAGTYTGDLVVGRRVHLVGVGRPLLIGSGADSVVQIRAAGVVFEGFEIDGRGGGDLGRDASGIHVSAPGVIVRDHVIHDTLFGVYLREAHDAVVQQVHIRGIRGRAAGEKGSGIHVWNTRGFRLVQNDIAETRDGCYIQSSPGGFIARNTVSRARYALHYMFSDDNRFEDNLFERSDAGAALMYSRRIAFRRNRFLHNRGFASVGLLLKNVDDVVAEDNLIADNARGIVLDTSYRNLFERNVIAESDQAVIIYDSSADNRIERNSFVANLTPVTLIGRRTDTLFRQNYWSDNVEPDLDGDGISDRPYRLSNVLDHFRENVLAADLYARTLAASAIAAAEQAFPVLEATTVEDRAPLARPPVLDQVPRAAERKRRPGSGLVLAGAALVAGLCLLRPMRRGA